MIKGSIDSIESMGLVDGPGIRTVIFLSGCTLRCKYCHNPEMWIKGKENYTPEELVKKIKKFKPYYGNDGGVTFSGGEPLLQKEFIIETSKLLKLENINIALDTAGVGVGDYQDILAYMDLIIFDIKHVTSEGYKSLTGKEIDKSLEFIKKMNTSSKPCWVRQVVVPGIHDNMEYLKLLKEFIKDISNIKKIDFLPYHKLGSEKYETIGIINPYKDMKPMDKEKCNELYQTLINLQ